MKHPGESPFIIQIYEVQEPREALELIEMGVNHIGSVLVSQEDWKDSILKETISLTAGSEAKSSLIPLFCDLKLISKALEYYKPDIVHLCDELTVLHDDSTALRPQITQLAELQAQLKKRFPEIGIIRSIPIPKALERQQPKAIAGTFDLILKMVEVFEPVSDFFLTDTLLVPQKNIDACEQPVTGFVGITGETCDWDLAERLVEGTTLPVILAGGLAPHNVYDGILKTLPAGVDSCTRTNLINADGKPIRFKKDMDQVRHFIRETKKALNVLQKNDTTLDKI